MLIYPSSQDIYPIGTMLQTQVAPSNKWERCYGQVVAKADYPQLLAKMDNIHPMRWSNWEYFRLFYDDDPNLYGILYNGTKYVMFGYGGKIAYSTDLVNWTLGTPLTGNYYAGCVGGTTFFVAAYNSNKAATSTDGENWTVRTMPLTKNWWWCCWDGTYFFVAPNGNYNGIIRSTDGASWDQLTGVYSDTSGYQGYYGMASDGAGTLVALHTTGTIGVSTDHGSTWSTVNPTAYGARGMNYVNGKFVTTTWTGYVGSSSDGINWEFYNCFSSDEPYFYDSAYEAMPFKWVYQNGIYIGIEGSDNYSILKCLYYSYDLKIFYPIFRPTMEYYSIVDIIWDSANDRFFLLSDSGGQYGMYLTEFSYDDSLYFQFPNTVGDHVQERGKQWYLKVR